MSDIAIRVDNLSKLYHLGALHQRPDTTSQSLSTSLRDALTGFLPRISRTLAPARSAGVRRNQTENSLNSPNSRQASQVNSPNSPNSRQASQVNSPNSPNSRQVSDDLWALKDVSFDACPECNRRVKRGEVVGTPALASGASVIGRNGAGTLAPARSAGESTLVSTWLNTRLKILSRITEPTSGRAGALLTVADAQFRQKR